MIEYTGTNFLERPPSSSLRDVDLADKLLPVDAFNVHAKKPGRRIAVYLSRLVFLHMEVMHVNATRIK